MRVFDYGKAYDQKLISMNPFGKVHIFRLIHPSNQVVHTFFACQRARLGHGGKKEQIFASKHL